MGERLFCKYATFFFVAATIGLYTSTHRIMWDPGYSFGFLGYFIMGYVIKKKCRKENGWKAIGLILGGVLVLSISAIFLYIKGIEGIGNKSLLDSVTGASAPPVVIASLLIFSGFTKLQTKLDISNLSKMSFTIYLFHAGIWDVLSIFIKHKMDNRVVIPLMIVVVFILSWISTLCWQYLWKKFDDKCGFTIRVCKKLSL